MGSMELVQLETKKLELETQKFELEQRRAKALSVSAFFPDTLKGDIASAVIIYDLAQRMNISVMEVAQNIFIIHGRPSFSTNFLVARLNQSGKIKGALKTVVSDDGQSAYCTAVDAETGETLKGMTVTMEMAQKEGWLTKKGSKWQTMPELMLRKRAQSFFIKEFYPEVMFGLQTVEEVQDIIETEAIQTPNDDLNAKIFSQPKEEANDEKPKTKPKKKRATRKKREVEVPQDVVDAQIEEATAPKQDVEAGVQEPEVAQHKQEMDVHVDTVTGEVLQPNPTQAPTTATEETPTSRRKGDQDEMIPYPIAVHVGRFINAGLDRKDLKAFIEKSKITVDNVDMVAADIEGLKSLVEMFYAEQTI